LSQGKQSRRVRLGEYQSLLLLILKPLGGLFEIKLEIKSITSK
jgi:hypothetical protein